MSKEVAVIPSPPRQTAVQEAQRSVNVGLKKARGKVSTQMIEDFLADIRGEKVSDPGSPLVFLRSVVRDPLAKTADRMRAAEILVSKFVPQMLEISQDEDGPGTLSLSAQRMNIALGLFDTGEKKTDE